jgi:glycosyltransferase involved in cell wall biosynthesis
VYYRLQTMAELGEEIDLLTYGQGRDVDIKGVRIIRIPGLRLFGEVRVGPSFLKLLHDAMILVYSLALLIRHRYDYVHAHEEGVYIACLMKPFFRFRLLYDMHSSLPEQLTNFSYTRSRALIRLFEWAEKKAVKTADAVIVVCPALLSHAIEVSKDSSKIVLIENSLFDEVILRDKDRSDYSGKAIEEAEALHRSGNALIIYSGTFESYQGIELLLEGFSLLAAEEESAVLLIIGGEPKQIKFYRAMADRLCLSDRCLVFGRVPQKVVMSCNRLAAMLVSPRLGGTNTPMKVYAQMASGVPIIATRVESHTQVLNADVAVLVAPDRVEMARGMKEILADPVAAGQKADNARKLYEEKYSRNIYLAKTREVLELLSGDFE